MVHPKVKERQASCRVGLLTGILAGEIAFHCEKAEDPCEGLLHDPT